MQEYLIVTVLYLCTSAGGLAVFRRTGPSHRWPIRWTLAGRVDARGDAMTGFALSVILPGALLLLVAIITRLAGEPHVLLIIGVFQAVVVTLFLMAVYRDWLARKRTEQ